MTPTVRRIRSLRTDRFTIDMVEFGAGFLLAEHSHTWRQIQQAIQRALGESGLTRQGVLEQLRGMAFATLAEVATYDAERGLVLKPDALSHPALESVERSFDAEGRERIKITRHNSLVAWALIAKILRLMEPDQASLAERVTLVIERATEPTPKVLGSGRPA